MNSKRALATLIGVSLAAGLGANIASANPFGYSDLASGYNHGGSASDEVKKPEEGKCGADKKAKHEGKCGADKTKAEADKAKMEGKCGEGKCGANKDKKEHTEDKPKS